MVTAEQEEMLKTGVTSFLHSIENAWELLSWICCDNVLLHSYVISFTIVII